MTKKKNGSFTDWSNVINNMKMKVEYYYLKDDKERKQPFKVTGIHFHYITGESFVNFYPLRVDDPVSYVLEKETFINNFEQVIEEV
jgi:hypothetical protein